LPKDSFTAALAQLDPASRALLDLSLRRGMRPEEISELLGTDPESVIVAREQALEHLAAELEMDDVSELDDVRARLAELPAEAWTGRAVPEVEDEPVPAEPPQTERKSRLPLLLALLAVAAVVLAIVLASSGGDDPSTATSEPTPAPKPEQSKPTPAKPPARAPKVPLTAVAGGNAKGTASLLDGGKRLRLDVTGLPPAAYQVWLYDSVVDAVSLTKVRGARLAVNLKLPANASHFRYIDISREPDDGNPNHSGMSVMRVPLAKLSR
jgi:hypothetical protein